MFFCYKICGFCFPICSKTSPTSSFNEHFHRSSLAELETRDENYVRDDDECKCSGGDWILASSIACSFTSPLSLSSCDKFQVLCTFEESGHNVG